MCAGGESKAVKVPPFDPCVCCGLWQYTLMRELVDETLCHRCWAWFLFVLLEFPDRAHHGMGSTPIGASG